MARMSYEEKQERREARYYGERCAASLRQFTAHQYEALQWRKVLGEQNDHTRMWQRRADAHVEDAREYAMKAAHHAGLATALRAFARHQAADPHCTCNDCIEHFSRPAADESEGSERS